MQSTISRRKILALLVIASVISGVQTALAQTWDTIVLDGQPISDSMVDKESGLLNLRVVRNNEDVEVFVPSEYRIIKSSKPASAIIGITETFLWVFKKDIGYLYVFEDVYELNVVIGENRPYSDNLEIQPRVF